MPMALFSYCFCLLGCFFFLFLSVPLRDVDARNFPYGSKLRMYYYQRLCYLPSCSVPVMFEQDIIVYLCKKLKSECIEIAGFMEMGGISLELNSWFKHAWVLHSDYADEYFLL